MQYHKINGVFKRDYNNKFIMWDWAQPEFHDLQSLNWHATEKIDGTNMRVYVHDDGSITIKGRTDKAQLVPELLDHINGLDFTGCEGLVLYGEGYGGRVQRGANYSKHESFILFDALTPTQRWLMYDELESVSERNGIALVESAGWRTLNGWIEMFQSHDFPLSVLRQGHAEGLVLTPAHGYRDRYGKRIITKLKKVDFC